MARRGIARAASLIDGFNAMYDTIGRVQRDRELAQVASAMPTMDEGFTPEQGAQLQAAANSGQYDIAWDEATKGYKVTAKADPNAVGTIAPQQRQTFMGQVQDRPLDAAGVNRARQLAMAGVLERHGDIEGGARVRDRVSADEDRAYNRERTRKAAEREDWRFAQEQKKVDDDEAYRTGMTGVIDGSVFGQRSKTFREAMSKYEGEKKAYDAKVAAGDTSALPPTMPAQPTMTASEKLLDAANVVAYKAQHGRASPEELMAVSEKMVQLQEEGYTRMLRMAQSGAPLTQVVAAFNQQGKGQLDPSSIVEDKVVKRPGGVESRLITYRMPDGRTQTIDTFAELTGLGKAEEALKQAQQVHQQRIQERQVAVSEGNLRVNQAAEGRHQAEFKAGAPERDAKAEEARLRSELAKTEDPARQRQIQEKLQALKTGTRGGGGTAAADPAKVREAQAIVAAGLAPDMASALELVISNPDKQHQALVEKALNVNPNGQAAVKIADDAMSAMGWKRNGNRWTKAGGGGLSFATEAEAEAAAKSGKIKAGDRITIGGQSGTWR